MAENPKNTQLAAVYFMGALAMFTASWLMLADAHLAVRIGFLVIGLALVVVGAMQLRRERGRKG